jgi:hypothetical protein
MDAYLIFIALISGILSVPIALIEISLIRHYILQHQGADNIPFLEKNEKKINVIIRKFRKKIFSGEINNMEIVSLRKKINYFYVYNVHHFIFSLLEISKLIKLLVSVGYFKTPGSNLCVKVIIILMPL